MHSKLKDVAINVGDERGVRQGAARERTNPLALYLLHKCKRAGTLCSSASPLTIVQFMAQIMAEFMAKVVVKFMAEFMFKSTSPAERPNSRTGGGRT